MHLDNFSASDPIAALSGTSVGTGTLTGTVAVPGGAALAGTTVGAGTTTGSLATVTPYNDAPSGQNDATGTIVERYQRYLYVAASTVPPGPGNTVTVTRPVGSVARDTQILTLIVFPATALIQPPASSGWKTVLPKTVNTASGGTFAIAQFSRNDDAAGPWVFTTTGAGAGWVAGSYHAFRYIEPQPEVVTARPANWPDLVAWFTPATTVTANAMVSVTVATEVNRTQGWPGTFETHGSTTGVLIATGDHTQAVAGSTGVPAVTLDDYVHNIGVLSAFPLGTVLHTFDEPAGTVTATGTVSLAAVTYTLSPTGDETARGSITESANNLLVGTTAGTGTTTGNLTVPGAAVLTGTTLGTGTTIGAPRSAPRITGTVAGTGTTSGALNIFIPTFRLGKVNTGVLEAVYATSIVEAAHTTGIMEPVHDTSVLEPAQRSTIIEPTHSTGIVELPIVAPDLMTLMMV
jgi:hypothetical protein